MKILISAYACEPGAGSEPGTGWEWARAAALDHDVWLLTRKNNSRLIEEARKQEDLSRLRSVYLDLPRWASWWKKGRRGLYPYYFLWQAFARQVARRLHAEISFDVAHHLTFASDWMPAGVCGINGLPSVWGPVGGITGVNLQLLRWLGWKGVLRESIREVTTRLLRHLFGRPVAKKASLLLAQNHDVASAFRPYGRVIVEPHVAISGSVLETTEKDNFRIDLGNSDFRAIFAGRIIPLKGLRLALTALSLPKAENWTLDVYGDGSDLKACKNLANRLGIGERVAFRGSRARQEVALALSRSNALLFPSMHDSGGWIVAEAVTLGVPVICLDRGGPPVLVGNFGCVIKTDGNIPADIAEALYQLERNDRPMPSQRWSSDRLPDMLRDFYSLAVNRLESS